MYSALDRLMCCDVLLVDTETVMQKAITRQEEEEADEGEADGRQSLGCVREVRPGHCVELTSSLAESGVRPAHSKGLHSTSAAHQSLSPLPPLPLFSLSQLKKKAYNLIFFHIRKHSFPLESWPAEMVNLF